VITHVFAGIPVADVDAALDWYGRLTGRVPDLVPNETEAAWSLSGTGWIYIVVDADHTGSGLITLLVDDLDSLVAELAERGITSGPVETIGSGVRRTLLTDPDGNRIKVGQPPDQTS
jgi:glyoxylase I family protein